MSLPIAERPGMLPGIPDLDEVERVVRQAIDDGRPELVNVVGYGEFSLAMRWTVGEEEVVVKRIPPFRDRASAEQFCDLTRRYIAALEAADVACVPTEQVVLDRGDRSSVVFHVQPLIQPERLVSNVLRSTAPDASHPVVDAVLSSAIRATAPTVAFDGQCSNWGWFGERAWYLDFSTPLLLDDDGRIGFDLDGFSAEYPAFLRVFTQSSTNKLAQLYTRRDHVLHDIVSLLHREHLEQWCDAFITVAREKHGIEIDGRKAAKMFRTDASIYKWAHRLRKLQRFWMQHTGRRYETLIADVSSYNL